MREAEEQTRRLEAQAVLKYLLDKAARRLSNLKEPAVVAACPDKFDDTGRFPDWLGVQVGDATWERTDHRRDGSISERSHNPEDLLAAREVLRWLQDAEWRPLVELAFSLKLYNEVLAVIKQHGALWFVISASNDGEDIAFLIGSSGVLERVGTPERLDQRLGNVRPLLLRRINPDAWPKLHAAVPAFPLDRSLRESDADARTQLVEMLQDAFSKLGEHHSTFFYVASAPHDPAQPASGWNWRVIAAEGFSIVKFSWVNADAYKKQVARHGATAQALDEVLNKLEIAKWRDLFVRGVLPLSRDASLGLFVRGLERWLIAAETAVFALTPGGGLDCVGACDLITPGETASRTVIHLFNDL
jgi:hypothetical protein